MNSNYLIIIGILLAVIAIIIVIFSKKKRVLTTEDTSEIIIALGGSANIKDFEQKVSRINVYVNETALVDIERIKEITSSGILLVSNKVQIILNEDAQTMNNILKDLKMRD